jgi:primosomal protein N'
MQTFIPVNETIKSFSQNYKNFFINTLEERKLFNYPPFTEMLTLEYRHKNKQKSIDFMEKLKNKLDLLNQNNISLPVGKVR